MDIFPKVHTQTAGGAHVDPAPLGIRARRPHVSKPPPTCGHFVKNRSAAGPNRSGGGDPPARGSEIPSRTRRATRRGQMPQPPGPKLQ